MSTASVPVPEATRTRWPLIAVAGVVIAAAGWYAVTTVREVPESIPMRDFVEYYSAARVNLARGNPYSGAELLPVQRAATGEPDMPEATMMWNPPWVLPLVTPFGLLPAGASHLLFMACQLGCLMLSATWLWRVYQGPTDKVWIAWAIAAFCPPALFLFWWGQIGAILLLGLAGFLYFRHTDRPMIAGLFAALTATKPHLLFGFGLVLVLDALYSRKGRIAVFSGGCAIAALAGLAWLINPDVYHHYTSAEWTTATQANNSPKDWCQPLAAYWLRITLNHEQFWIQFVPTAVAAVGIAGYWFARRKTWSWADELPMLVFVSALTAAYGAWMFDLVVLLVPGLAAAARLVRADTPRAALPVLGLFVGVTLLAVLFPKVNTLVTGSPVTGMQLYVWFTPVVLMLCWAAGRAARGQ